MNKKTLPRICKVLLLFSNIILIFTCVNLFWTFTVAIPYNGFISVVEEQKDQVELDRTNYKIAIDGYIYEVKKPGYLDFNSFLSVYKEDYQTIEIDKKTGEIVGSSGMSVNLYIWPDLWGNYEYGVFFNDEAEGIFEQIMIDSDINYLPSNPDNIKLNEKRQKLIDDNYEDIFEMMQTAKELWSID